MLTWGQRSANSINTPDATHLYLVTPCLGHYSHSSVPYFKSCLCHLCPSTLSVLWDTEVQFFICQKNQKDSWIGSAPSLSLPLASYFCPTVHDSPLVFPFSRTLPHLLNTCISHHLIWSFGTDLFLCVHGSTGCFFSFALHAFPDFVAIQPAESHPLLRACLEAWLFSPAHSWNCPPLLNWYLSQSRK